MRNATWVTAAISMFACAQGAPAGDPLVDVAAGAPRTAPDAGANPAPDAGAPAGPCNPSIAAGEGVAIHDTGACPGLVPATVSCAADITLCGYSTGMDPPRGSFAALASSDGRGSVALSCGNVDIGPSHFSSLFVPTPSGFVSRAPLGSDVRPLADGFISSSGSYWAPDYDFLAHDGSLRATQPGGTLYAGPNGAVILRAVDGQLVAQSVAADGTAFATVTVVTPTTPAAGLMLGGAMTTSGATLLIWQVYGESTASARWLAPDGSLASPSFSIEGWTEIAPVTASLAGGSVAIAARPNSGDNTRRWRGVVAPGETVERAAPAWLASRGEFLLLPAGKGMVFGTEVVGAGGTACGTLDLGARLVGIGVDGTAFTALSDRTFRIYPQLFR